MSAQKEVLQAFTYPALKSLKVMDSKELWEIFPILTRTTTDNNRSAYEFAQAYTSRALELDDVRLIIRGLSYSAEMSFHMGNPKEMNAYMQRLSQYESRLENNDDRCFFYSRIGTWQSVLGNLEAGINNLLLCTSYYHQGGAHSMSYAQAILALMEIYRDNGMYHEAVRLVLESEKVLEDGSSLPGNALFYEIAADVYRICGDMQKHEHYVKLELELNSALGNEINLADSLIRRTIQAQDDKHHEQALNLVRQATAIYKRVGGEWQYKAGRISEASILRALQLTDQAIAVLDEIRLNQTDFPRLFALHQLESGRCNVIVNKLDAALQQFKHLAAACGDAMTDENTCELYADLADVCARLGKIDDSRAYISKHLELKKNLISLDRQRKIAQAEYQAVIRDAESEAAKLRADLAERKNQVHSSKAKLQKLTIRLDHSRSSMQALKQSVQSFARKSAGRQRRFAERLLNKFNELDGQAATSNTGNDEAIDVALVYEDLAQHLARLDAGLTPTEIKVCLYIFMSLSSKEIAANLCRSPETIRTHRSNIRKKLKLEGRSLGSFLQEIADIPA